MRITLPSIQPLDDLHTPSGAQIELDSNLYITSWEYFKSFLFMLRTRKPYDLIPNRLKYIFYTAVSQYHFI